MLKLVTATKDIERYQQILETKIKENFNETLQIKNWEFNCSDEKNDIWYWAGNWEKDGFKWYLNEFGFLSELEERVITVAFNIKITEEPNLGTGGFAMDDSGDVRLIHKGNFCRIEKTKFFDWYSQQSSNFLAQIKNGNKTKDIIDIGKIDSDDFVQRLVKFIKCVDYFKKKVVVGENESKKNSVNSKTAPISKKTESINIPQNLSKDFENVNLEKIERVIFVYQRNQDLVEKAKKLANGECRLCGLDAPFESTNGEPYLEVHHVQWLSKNGADALNNVVALCPNCHRKMHSLNEEADVKKLTKIAKSQR